MAFVFFLCRVQLEGKEPDVIHVTGHAVDSALQLLGLESDIPLKCVRFGATYFGSDVTQCAVLYNNGPEAVKFVIILNDCAEGQILVISVCSLHLFNYYKYALRASFLLNLKECPLLFKF